MRDIVLLVCSFLQQSLARASDQRDPSTSTKVMGNGDGLVLEADVGFKDGQGDKIFCPLDDGATPAHHASHDEEDAQVSCFSSISFPCLHLVSACSTHTCTQTHTYRHTCIHAYIQLYRQTDIPTERLTD